MKFSRERFALNPVHDPISAFEPNYPTSTAAEWHLAIGVATHTP